MQFCLGCFIVLHSMYFSILPRTHTFCASFAPSCCTPVLQVLSVILIGFLASRDAQARGQHGSSATCELMKPEEQDKLRQELLQCVHFQFIFSLLLLICLQRVNKWGEVLLASESVTTGLARRYLQFRNSPFGICQLQIQVLVLFNSYVISGLWEV